MSGERDWKSWIVGAMFTVLLTVGGVAMAMVQTRIAAEEATRKDQVEVLQQLVLENRERLAANEATIRAMDGALKTANDKLDQLIRMHMK